MKAAIYCRVSTEDQGKEGTSLGSQLYACSQKAKELGYEVPDGLVFKETFSGLQQDRPQLNIVRQKASNGEFDVLIVYSPDRLSRVGEDILGFLKEFKLSGVKLILVREQFEDSITGKMVAFLFGWASELEAAQIKERTRRGKKTKAANGFLPQGTGIGLYGYRWDKASKKRIILDQEAIVVMRIFNLIAEGHTRFEVAKILNDDGIPTKSGSKWHPLTIERIVTNEAYTGTTYFGKTARDGKRFKLMPKENWMLLNGVTPPIISRELFDQAQRVLRDSKELHRGRPQHEYLLTGHIRCGYCNSYLVGSCLEHKYRYYHCKATYPTSFHKATCNAGYIKADVVEKIVWDEVKKVIENPEVILASIKGRRDNHNNGNKIEDELAAAKKKMESYNEREQRLISLFEFDGITREDLADRINKVKAERQEAEKLLAQLISIKAQTIDIGSLESELNEFCRKVRESLDNCSFLNKRLALDTLQVQVIATPEKIDIQMTVPLEFTSLEQSHEYTLPVRKKKRRKERALIL
jgi:site-specific DNA recombinase